MKTRLDETNKMRKLMGLSLLTEEETPNTNYTGGDILDATMLNVSSKELQPLIDELNAIVVNTSKKVGVKKPNDTNGVLVTLVSKNISKSQMNGTNFQQIQVGDRNGGVPNQFMENDTSFDSVFVQNLYGKITPNEIGSQKDIDGGTYWLSKRFNDESKGDKNYENFFNKTKKSKSVNIINNLFGGKGGDSDRLAATMSAIMGLNDASRVNDFIDTNGTHSGIDARDVAINKLYIELKNLLKPYMEKSKQFVTDLINNKFKKFQTSLVSQTPR